MKLSNCLLFCCLLAGCRNGAVNPAFDLGKDPPKLVVVAVVDGLPQKQLTQYQDQLSFGLKHLLEEGAWTNNGNYRQVTTVTASGHATILTGVYPNRHGLIANDWLDRVSGERVYCVEDADVALLGVQTVSHAGTSPRSLLAPTVGDALRLRTEKTSKVFSIAGKDRSALIMGGKLANSAYFFNFGSGRFVSSRFYLDEYPAWWKSYYQNRPQDGWLGESWSLKRPIDDYWQSEAPDRKYAVRSGQLGTNFPYRLDAQSEASGRGYYDRLMRSPFGDDYLLEFVERAVVGEGLGKNPHGVPDFLAVGFSAHDYINHDYGPESSQSQDHVLRLDETLGNFLDFLDDWIGLGNVALVLTSDHGFSNVPEYCSGHGIPAGRLDPEEMMSGLEEHLRATFQLPGNGTGRKPPANSFLLSWRFPMVYLNRRFLMSAGLELEAVESAAAQFLVGWEGVQSVFTRSALSAGDHSKDPLAERVLLSWHPERSGDLMVIQKPCWYLSGRPDANAATHGSPHAYDTHVPILFFGRWFRPGPIETPSKVVDIAATLSQLLGLPAPSGSQGRVLAEILQN